jgi:GMP synthase (glutamine-hydrolysing)
MTAMRAAIEEPMKPLLILQTGRVPAPIRARLGDFPHWFRLGLKLAPERMRIVNVEAGEVPPSPSTISATVITGSGAMITERANWSERAADWIRAAMDAGLPMLGVCYGHQLMAHALGGSVGWLPGGCEIGTRRIETLDTAVDDPLLAGMPRHFLAHTTHSQSVLQPPHGARILAGSAQDPHQMLRYADHAVSMQFHPEFSVAAMRAYLHLRADTLRQEGLNVTALLKAVTAAPVARRLLRRFALRTYQAQ